MASRFVGEPGARQSAFRFLADDGESLVNPVRFHASAAEQMTANFMKKNMFPSKLCLVALTGLVGLMGQAGETWKAAEAPIKSRWASEVSPENALPEYPRPQMVRKEWRNLNGLWDYAIAPKTSTSPITFQGKILVPYPIESALSGVMKRVSESERIWYRRTFTIPANWMGRRVLLNFGAVDFEAKVYVNEKLVGEHVGGYDGFSFDITDLLRKYGENDIVVAVSDPTDAGTQPRGKQVRKPNSIWYTPTSGIWQTVWIEPVSAAHISSLKIVPDIDAGTVSVKPVVTATLGSQTVEVTVRKRGEIVVRQTAAPGAAFQLPIKNARLWSPEDPQLYDITVALKLGSHAVDQVESYFGMRKISLGKDAKGFTRLMLNNKPYFQAGPLDQGFWPDGLYTAPTDEALRYDIEMTKKLGFNMARKHVKIEPDRWYYWCDKLGLLVWQDMPSGDKYIGPSDPDITRSPESARQYERELTSLVGGLGNHPCIVMWVPFNEGWGQYDTARIAELVRQLDPSRLVNSVSGWADRNVGDVYDIHVYPGPAAPKPEEKRAGVLGEFGGLGFPVRGHTWQNERNWGYRNYTNESTLTQAYLDLMVKLFPLIESHGLSAAVYTQTTDVEGEVNGLMTYDRAMVKMDIEKLAKINRGDVPPPSVIKEIVPTAKTKAATWRYTTEKPQNGWFLPDFDASGWKEGQSGFGTEGTPGAVIGTTWSGADVWLRREFSWPGATTGDVRLMIHHDEDAEVFINGVLAITLTGHTTAYEPVAISLSAATALQGGANVMAIHCRNTTGGQFIDAGLVLLEPGKK
jgi:hypothetical protein